MRFKNKTYLKLGRHGELQWGHVSHTVVLWWHGRRYLLFRRKSTNL